MATTRRTPSRRPGPRRVSGPGRRGATRPRATGAPEPARPRFTGRAAILVLVVAVLMVSYASSMRAYLEQKRELDGLRQTITDARGNIARLEREKQRWHDRAFVKQQARQRFGFVMPGEVGYQVIGADGKPLDADTSLSTTDPTSQDPGKAWWQQAWGSVRQAGDPGRHAPRPATKIRDPRKQR